jgi:hypothetical protein
VGEVRTEWEIIAELAERMTGRAPIFAVMGLGKKLAGWSAGASLHVRSSTR